MISHNDMLNGKLVTTGNYPVPNQINQGVVFARFDTTIKHEESDTMIFQQEAYVGAANILIVADHTYLFGHLLGPRRFTNVFE